MKARHLFTALLALTTVTAVACDDEDEDPNGPPDTNTFEASLTGAQEVPPVTTPATASATFISSTSGATTTIQYTVTVTGNLSGPVTAAHIHGPAGTGVNANPIVTLTVSNTTGRTGVLVSGSFTTTGNASVTMAQLLTHMLAGNTYVNLHTTANPNGEIRGQIAD
ncbi:MAG TPA: CHRD domain-containing protein [Gemmatimonadaceae bacterium]|nr:CHRD domain-containing protein [Gemmatimonadaceae bacterium]